MIGIAAVSKVPLLLEKVRAHAWVQEPPTKETATSTSTLASLSTLNEYHFLAALRIIVSHSSVLLISIPTFSAADWWMRLLFVLVGPG